MERGPGAHQYAEAEAQSKRYVVDERGNLYRLNGRVIQGLSKSDHTFLAEWASFFELPYEDDSGPDDGPFNGVGSFPDDEASPTVMLGGEEFTLRDERIVPTDG